MIHTEQSTLTSPNDIAIVGMSARFPGATTLEQFWDNLRSGAVSIIHLNEEELHTAGVDAADLASAEYIRVASRIENAEDFDADYFNYSPVEASFIDPQHRIFLECSVEALEDAGCDPRRFPGQIGVFAGCALNIRHLSRALSHFDETLGEPQLFTILANDKDYLATRLSYKLNLTGPSINVQAACSTSLVAVHLACQSLLSGECDAAIAGGASVVFSYAKMGYRFSEGSVFSSTGDCRPFDADASGTVFGDGVGVVVLKRLEDALASGDNIRAVIKGSALNNDGSRKASFAAPSVSGQANVIAEAIAMAGIPAETISYIEAHGTGTSIGDPIEIEGLKRVFSFPVTGERCAIGSVKGNIGHLNAAAGIAGLIKTVLALEHDEIPPTAQFTRLNPKIDFIGTPFFINDQPVAWGGISAYRRAGISSFGIGGTNAHVVLERAPSIKRSFSCEARSRAFLLSARSTAALDQMAQSLGEFLTETPDVDLADLARTLSEGRTKHAMGLAVLADDAAALTDGLKTRSPSATVQKKVIDDDLNVVMAFPGQGSQCIRMGQGIYCQEPVYRENFDLCLEILEAKHGVKLRDAFAAQTEQGSTCAKLLDRTDQSQPAVFATSYALAQLWLSWGVRPTALIGHSLGELVAACIAGVFSLEDALNIVAVRGRLMNAAEPGAMVAIMASPDEVVPHLCQRVCIASYNGPRSCVVAGPQSDVEALMHRLTLQALPHTLLKTSHAFHTSAMTGAVDPFVAAVAAIKLKPPSIPFISNVSGTWITTEQATSPEYWGDHILRPVRFEQGVASLSKDCSGVVLEVGPGRQLSGLLDQIVDGKTMVVVPSIPRPGREDGEHSDLLHAAASLALAGVVLDWDTINHTHKARKIVVPKYPFQRRTYRLSAADSRPTPRMHQENVSTTSLLGAVNLYEPSWRRTILHPALETAERQWLVFSDQGPLSSGIIAALRAKQTAIIVVTKDSHFQQHAPDHFSCKPGFKPHIEQLLQALQTSENLPNAVLYLWPLESSDTKAKTAESSFFDVTSIVTLIKSQDLDRQLDVFLFSTNGQDVFGAGGVDPAGSVLLGLARSLPEEMDALDMRYLDFDEADLSKDRVEATVEGIWPVFADNKPRILAWRNGRFLTPALDTLFVNRGITPRIAKLVENGAWLITGGLGGIGLALAQELVRRGARKLALVSRRPLPARGSWDEILATNAPEAEHLRAIRALESSGAVVEMLMADVSDQAALEVAFIQTRNIFGQVDAVIHCAGVVDGGQAVSKSAETALSVLRPKIDGILNIEAICAEFPLELLVLCSSVTTLLNNPGQTDYAAANAFLDSFASSSTTSAKRVIAINWDSWSEVGMAANYIVPEAFREARDAWLQGGLTTNEGVEGLFDALSANTNRVVITKMAIDEQGHLIQTVAVQSTASESGICHPRPDLGIDYAAPRSEIETVAARIMAEMLNLQLVGIDDNFLDLGCHSLTASRFVAKMRQETGVTIPLVNLFEGLTLRKTIDALQLEEWEEGVI